MINTQFLKVGNLFSTLSGGKVFSKIDLSQAYHQLSLAVESKPYVTINTHKGQFRYTRLPYGISSALGIFQRIMENVLKGIPNVIIYLDDILISGADEHEHLQILEQVLTRLDNAGLRVKKEKCEFLVPPFTYLGRKIEANGLHPLPEKVKAVEDAPNPWNIHELRAYLGLISINFCRICLLF